MDLYWTNLRDLAIGDRSLDPLFYEPSLNRREVGSAMLEARAAGADSSSAELLRALITLRSGLEEAAKEMARRRRLFLKLVQGTGAARDPRRGWESVYGALESEPAMGSVTLLDFLDFIEGETSASRLTDAFPSERVRSEEVNPARVFHWLFGFRMPRALNKPLGEALRMPPGEQRREALYRFAQVLERCVPDADTGAIPAIFGTAARVAGIVGTEGFDHLTRWLETCRLRCSPGKRGSEALKLFASSCVCALGLAGGNGAKLGRMLRILGNSGSLLLRAEYAPPRRWEQKPPDGARILEHLFDFESSWAMAALLAEYPELDEKAIEILSRNQLFPLLAVLAGDGRGDLAQFLRWLQKAQVDTGFSSNLYMSHLAEFIRAHPGQFRILLGWCDQQMAAGDCTWSQLGYCVDDLIGVLLACSQQREKRPKILERELWVCDEISKACRRFRSRYGGTQADDSTPSKMADDLFGECKSNYAFHALFCRRAAMLPGLILWQAAGCEGDRMIVEILLEKVEAAELEAIASQSELPEPLINANRIDLSLLVPLAGGDPHLFAELLQQSLFVDTSSEQILKGWQLLERYPPVQEILRALFARAEYRRRILAMLSRLSLMVRIGGPEPFAGVIVPWLALARPEDPETESAEYGRATLLLRTLQAYRRQAGESNDLPKVLRNILARRERLTQERDALLAKRKVGALDQAMAIRLEHLEQRLADEEDLRHGMERDLAKEVSKRLGSAKLAALEAGMSKVIQGAWRDILGDHHVDLDSPEWSNALELYYQTEDNRRILKSLLKHEARGDRSWRRRHPVNREFIRRAEASGIDLAVWLRGYEREFVLGNKRFRVYAENEPLRILHMGNYFDTCLSVDEFNSFATIANAVEINKRVFYVMDSERKIVGRKLIVLADNGYLAGYHTYGNFSPRKAKSHSPWAKILCDVCCRDLADRSGMKLSQQGDLVGDIRESEAQRRAKAMFTKWYDDGLERFDWWVRQEEFSPPPLGEAPNRTMRDKLKQTLADRRRPEEDVSSLHGLLWIGEHGPALLEESLRHGTGFSARRVEFLIEHCFDDKLQRRYAALL